MAHLGPFVFVAFLLGLTLAALPLVRSRIFDRALVELDAVADRPAAAIAICAALSLVGSALVAYLVMWPEPRVHDEFSYILAGDTFAHGRLANPTHPLWQFFESFHIVHQPTYASKYPPAQGAAIALGEIVLGEPLAGVWLGGALMCGAICWMLYAYVTPRWALLGGIVATLQIGIATYWTQTYWGGALAAAGSALVFGATPRLARSGRARDAVILAAGLLLLANARPFDGAITSLAAAGYLVIALAREPRRLLPAIPPLAIVLALGVGAMAYYNHVVTGHWWLHPYIHHDRTYIAQPTLTLQEWRPVEPPRHEVMRRVHEGKDATTAGREGSALTLRGLGRLRNFFAGRGIVVPLAVGVACAVVRPDGLLLLAGVGLATLALTLLHFFQFHYAAAMTGPVFGLLAIGFERVSSVGAGRSRVGEAFCVAALVATTASLVFEIQRVPNLHTAFGHDDFYFRRLAALDELRRSPGRDLVVVSYGPKHRPHADWVYNAADIDRAEVVWARDMGAERNAELLTYFRDGQGRKVWLLRNGFDDKSDGLSPYPSP